MTTRRLVDVMVIGGRVGPLVSACLLARRGYKVVHVEHEGLASSYRDNGLFLPLEPDLLPGPRSSPVIQHVLDGLALSTDARRLLRPIQPGLQVITPGHRFELSSESQRRGRELVREFGEEEAHELQKTISALLEADEAVDPLLASMPPLPPSNFRERRAIRKAASGLPIDSDPPSFARSNTLRAASAGLARISSFLAKPEPTGLHAVRCGARMIREQPHRLLDGQQTHSNGYASLLRRRLQELGGVSLADGQAVAEEILLEGRRVAGLKVLGDATDYRCRYLVSGIDTASLDRILPLEGRRRRHDSFLDRVRPREILFSLNLVLRRKGFPAGLGEAALNIADPGASLVEENLILLEKFDALDEEGPAHDVQVLQASCFAPVTRIDLGDGYFEDLRDRMLKVLRSDLLPFLDRHLLLTSSPVLTRKGRARGARLMPHPLLESDLEPSVGGGFLTPRTPYKNLVLAGREVLPGLGPEGEFLTGHRAAETVAYAMRKHDPLKHQ